MGTTNDCDERGGARAPVRGVEQDRRPVVPSWEYLAAHGCLAVDSLTDEQLGQLGITRETLRRLAVGEAESLLTKPASWSAPTEEQTPPPKIL